MHRFKLVNTNEELIAKINAGLKFEKKGMPKDALENYEIANRMGNSALPPFLIGQIYLKLKKEMFTAERYLDEAINTYPGFALANIYGIKALIDSKHFDLATQKINAAMELPELSIWYIYYLQSILYYLQNDYEASLQVIQTKCRPLNPYFFEQYIMLGDIFLKLNNCTAAKENYLKAGELQPDNRTYSSRMQMMVNQCN
jgi:tetratricopeptide (TPR) repeat protein